DLQHKPKDFSFMKIEQYGAAVEVRKEESFSSLLDRYYEERDQIERMRVKSMDILKILSNRAERLSRKINNQRGEITKCDEKDDLRMKADLLNSSLYAVPKSVASVTLTNYYEENCPPIEIPLNPALSPSQNAQKYYKDYRRAKTAEIKLAEQIAIAEEELKYVDTNFYALTEARTEQDLTEIRTELTEQGYIRPQKNQKSKKSAASKPLEFITADGFTVLVGRNNRQNDKLTLKDAGNNDYWFHTKNIPGSHTVLLTEGKIPTDAAMEEAAVLAAKHSKAKDSTQVAVDYTKIRHVSKPQGAKPGMVIYVNYKTLFVNPTKI
ncbi:MAG: NFACT family protein, partial [Oscillospiraceae bacterium]